MSGKKIEGLGDGGKGETKMTTRRKNELAEK